MELRISASLTHEQSSQSSSMSFWGFPPCVTVVPARGARVLQRVSRLECAPAKPRLL